ncbi:TPA: 3-phosphoshikimate 1-carboxyvinyltransferase, partial [Candidatus Sumerlaeota bacterium]|nr:3-phosphoshikimate 1-carboxyvinyltransferase [Candidatus Sumerlaeota bacterium]
MYLHAEKSTLKGSVAIPGSKSHTIRALVLAALAHGSSKILSPLESLDTRAGVEACRAFGAKIDTSDPNCWLVDGVNGQPQAPNDVINVGNSGTTLYIIMSTAALVREGWTVITGDAQIRRRPCDKLIHALHSLGAEIVSTRGNCLCPLVIRGPWRGGCASIEAITSQWVSSILLNAPLASGETILNVPLLNEAPYVQMTLDWLKRLNVQVDHNADMSEFRIPGGQAWCGFERPVAADFSSATFFLVAGAALDA